MTIKKSWKGINSIIYVKKVIICKNRSFMNKISLQILFLSTMSLTNFSQQLLYKWDFLPPNIHESIILGQITHYH